MENVAFECQQRADLYGLLSRLYRQEVDDEVLDALQGALYPVDTGNESMDVGNYELAKFLSNRWANTAEDLAVDYSRCFIGRGIDAHSAAYPFESVYISEKRLLMQDARDEVLAIFRSEGMDKAEGFKEHEDHIAAELDFMQIMALRSAEAAQNADSDELARLLLVQQNFLEDHVGRWTKWFNEDIRRYDVGGFYRAVSLLCDGVLESDQAWLADFTLGEHDIEAA